MRNSRWVRLLAYVTGSVNQKLLLRNEYLAAENRILRAKLPPRLGLSNPERAGLAEIGKRLGRRALAEIACVAKPDTILVWYRKLSPEIRRLQTPTVSRPPSDFRDDTRDYGNSTYAAPARSMALKRNLKVPWGWPRKVISGAKR
jgi:hypothetical protein